MNFDNGYVSNGFVTDPARNCAELERPYVLVTNHPILNIRVRTFFGFSLSRSVWGFVFILVGLFLRVCPLRARFELNPYNPLST